MRLTTLIVVAALISAAPARADNTADEADIAFAVGNQAYAKRDYEQALAAYFLSYRLVPNRNVLFNIAHCYEAIDRLDEAYRYYHDLSVEPGLSAEDAKAVKASLARLSPKVALISITSTPPGADVYLDREDLGSRGKTPSTLAVLPGPHTVVVKLSGHRAASAKVAATKGKETTSTLALERVVGTVQLDGTPVGATVHETADGPSLGALPATLALVPGQKLLVVQSPGYLPSQVLLDVKPEETVSAKVALTEKPKPTGKVVVTANRENAVVRVDGKDSGFTPTVLTLSVGPHTIEVFTSETTPLTQTLEVREDAQERITAELRYEPPAVGAASKSALSVDQAPASVTVITREEIQAFGYQTLPEALAGVRGFFFSDDRIYTYIGVRGFSPPGDLNTRILILYDGHPINDVWAGQGYSARDFDVDLSEVERIEVVRGPASLLFGTGAFFGVINVVPRASLNSRHAEAVAAAGGLGGFKARVTGGLESGRNAVVLSAAGFGSSGAELTDLGTAGVVRGLDGERALGASTHATLGDFTLVGKINQRVKQVPTAPLGAQLGVPGTQYTDDRGFAELRYQHQWERLTIAARLNYDGSRFRGYYASRTDADEVVRVTDSGGGDWVGADVRASFTLFEGNKLTLSAEGAGQFVSQQPRDLPADPHTRVVLSATLLDEWRIISRVFVQAGVRADKYFDLSDIALSPRAAVVLKPYDAGVTKVVAGQAFRAPNVYELFFSDNNVSQRRPVSLRPELITTFELEHSHDVTPELRVTVGGYYNLIDRLVVLEQENADAPACGDSSQSVQCYVYSNSARRATALGAEAQLHWQPGRFTMIDAAYSFVVLGGEGRDAAGAHPTHLASLRAMVPLKDSYVRLAGQVMYQSARQNAAGVSAGEALLINVGLSGAYGAFRYFAGVRDLLNQPYALPLVTEVGAGILPQYGRTFWLELGAGF